MEEKGWVHKFERLQCATMATKRHKKVKLTLWIQNSKPFHEDLEMSERMNRIILNAPQLEQKDTVFRVITNDEQTPSQPP